jgi:hypothetical protein
MSVRAGSPLVRHPERFLEIVGAVEVATGAVWQVMSGLTGDPTNWSVEMATPKPDGVVWSLDHLIEDEDLPEYLVPDGDGPFADWPDWFLWADDPEAAVGAQINEHLDERGYGPAGWFTAPNPRFAEWMDEQPRPSDPLVLTVIDGRVCQPSLYLGRGGRIDGFAWLYGTWEVEWLKLEPGDLTILTRHGLKPLDHDGLAKAMRVSRGVAARVLDRTSGDVFLYDPAHWAMAPSEARPKPEPKAKAPKEHKATVAEKIAAILGDQAMTVADIASAIGSTNEATLIALKRGPFEQTNERPARWRSSTQTAPESQAP